MCDEQAEVCSAGSWSHPFWEGRKGACVAAAPRQLPGRLWPRWLLEPCRVGSGNKLLSSGCHSLWEREVGDGSYCAFGPAELWHACRRFCNFLCTLSACFSLSSAFAFVPKCCYCQEKKNKKKKFLLFNCLSL